jgi:hypothetical protein
MKKALFISGLFIVVNAAMAQEVSNVEKKNSPNSSTASASTKQKKHHLTPDQKADQFMFKINEAVKLDDGQKSKVRSLAMDHFIYMDNVRMQAKGDKEKIKTEAKNSRKIFNEGLKKVLSPEQFETWKTKKKESHKRQGMQPEGDINESLED